MILSVLVYGTIYYEFEEILSQVIDFERVFNLKKSHLCN